MRSMILSRLSIDLYRYVLDIYQVLQNEIHWADTDRHTTTLEHQLTPLFTGKSPIAGMACSMKNVGRRLLTEHDRRDLNNTKLSMPNNFCVPSATMPGQSKSHLDRRAYCLLTEFTDDYLPFVIKYFDALSRTAQQP